MGRNTFNMIISCLILVGVAATPSFAEQLRLCTNDWPVFEIARGIAALNRIDEFTVRKEKVLSTCVDGFSYGKFDIVLLSMFELMISQRKTATGVVIAVMDYSDGGDGVVLRPEIGSASELRGRTLGFQTDSLSLHFTEVYLNKHGMSLNDINIVNIKAEFVGKAFAKNKSLSGVVGWFPNLDEAIAAGGRLAATSSDFPETIFDVAIADRESLKKNRAVYKDFLKKWFVAIHDPVIIKKTADLTGVSDAEFEKWLKDAHIYPDVSSSLAAFPKLKKTARDLQAFFKTKPDSIKGKAASLFDHDRSLDVSRFFDDSLLKSLADEK